MSNVTKLADAIKNSNPNVANEPDLPPVSTADHSPSWQVFRPFASIANNGAFIKTLKATRKTLNSSKKILEKIQGYIDSARTVLNYVSLFEQLYKNLIYTFLNAIIDQLQIMLNDVKSTGVYMLDLISYHWINTSEINNAENISYLKAIAQGPWYDDFTGFLPAAAQEEVKAKILEDKFKAVIQLLKNVDKQYKRETYYEFIEVIVDSFQDQNDVPNPGLAYLSSPFDTTKYSQNTSNESQKILGAHVPNVIPSGRPSFGPDAHLKIYLVAFAMPDIGQVITLMQNIVTFLGDLIPSTKQVKAIIPALEQDIKGIPSSIQTAVSSTYDEAMKEIDKTINDATDAYNKIYRPVSPSSQEPNFIGVNLYTLFAPFFDQIQGLLNICRTIANKELPGIGGLIDTIMQCFDAIDKQIRRLLTLIEMIENFVRLIESILRITGLRILTFDTNNGIAGVVDGLRNSVDFGLESTKKRQEQNEITTEEATRNIASLEEQYNTISENLTSIQKRKSNLDKIKIAVDAWAVYVTNQGLYTKKAELIQLTDYYNAQILIPTNNKQTIINNHEDVNGLAYLRTTLATEWDKKLNGYTQDGITFEGYNDKILTLTNQKTDLENKHNDPSYPDIIDYDYQWNQIDLEIKAITQIKNDGQTEFDYTDDNYEWTQNNVTSAPWSSQLTIASDAFVALKEDNDPLHSGSAAQTFQNEYLAYDTLISGYNDDIDTLNLEITTDNNMKNSKRQAIYSYNSYAYLIEAEYYETHPLPPITDPAPWNDTNFRDLFLAEPNGYLWCVERLASETTSGSILYEIKNIRLLIAQAEIDKANKLIAWQNFSNTNVRNQKRYSLLKGVLNAEISKDNYDDLITSLNIDKNNALNAKNNEINIIIQNGWGTYLSPLVIYDKAVTPYSSDGVTIGDWTDNEICYLIWKEGYNRKEPNISNLTCSGVNNAIEITNKDLIASTQNTQTAKEAWETAIKDENERLEAVSVVKNSSWKATDKMYYGGFLLCYGWPKNLKERSTTGISTIYKQNYREPLQSGEEQFKTLASDEDISKATGKLLNWIMRD